MTRRPDVTAADCAARYDAGLSMLEISVSLRCSEGTVRDRLDEAGTKRRPRGRVPAATAPPLSRRRPDPPPAAVAVLMTAYLSGASLDRAAWAASREAGERVSRERARRLLAEGGVTVRGRGRPRKDAARPASR